MIRVRVTYNKNHSLRYISSLDNHKLWERTIRRAKLPLAYSQGFHPQPKINQVLPLPLGMTSKGDLIDIWFEEDISITKIRSALTKHIHSGIEIINLEEVDLLSPKLQSIIQDAEYEVNIFEQFSIQNVQDSIDKMLETENIQRSRSGKLYNLRPLIISMNILVQDTFETLTLTLRLSASAGATGRPDEVVSALGFDPNQAMIERTKLFLSDQS